MIRGCLILEMISLSSEKRKKYVLYIFLKKLKKFKSRTSISLEKISDYFLGTNVFIFFISKISNLS